MKHKEDKEEEERESRIPQIESGSLTSMASALPIYSSLYILKAGTQGMNSLPLYKIRFETIWGTWTQRSPQVADRIHPRVSRETADVVAKPLSDVFLKSCQSNEIPCDW